MRLRPLVPGERLVGDLGRVASAEGVVGGVPARRPFEKFHPRPLGGIAEVFTASSSPLGSMEIADKLYSAALEGVSPTASPEEETRRYAICSARIPEMFALWERLEGLMAANDESVILALAALEDEEEESQEEF